MSEPELVESALPEFETAFVVLKDEDGWVALDDLSSPFAIRRVITRSEVRQACHELSEAIRQQDTVNMILDSLDKKSVEDSQRVSASVRDALARRKED